MNLIRKLFVISFFATIGSMFSCHAVFLGVRGEKHSAIGLYIKDIINDSLICSIDADKCYMPASITKLYTSASAMCLLNDNFRFETKVYLTGSPGANGTWNGNLLIKASGDPTLESEFFPKNTGFIKQIVDAVRAKGITRITGDIVLARVDESHQYQEGPLNTWCIDDAGWSYGAGVFDFNWCDNYYGLFPATGKTTSPVPELNYEVWDKPWSGGLEIIKGVYSDNLIISGKKYATDSKAKVNTSMNYPFDVFRAKLTERLEDNDIAVGHGELDSSKRTLLITHSSPKLDDILRSLMLRSDNMYAEAMLRCLGEKYGDRSASIEAESKLWSSHGLMPEFNRILDGSGLSRANAISPFFLGRVLEWMAKSKMCDRYVRLFPIAGVNGTMKSFMPDSPLKGRLATKTGSVNAVQTYAGYLLDENGKPTHVIVFMANHFYCTRAELREALGAFLIDKLQPWL